MAIYIHTVDGITVMLKSKPFTISSSHKDYDKLVGLIKASATDEEIEEVVYADLRRMTEAVVLTPDITIKGGIVYYTGLQVTDSLSNRMVSMLHEGFDLNPMVAFLENIMQNTSHRAVRDLYTFLEYGAMPITPDGHFLAFKAVRVDWLDIHSGTMDNSIGNIIEMPRNRVDEDPNRTCSAGLHVCSAEYLPSFAHANGHVIVCKINPKDVVAIPADYHNTKMRVCRYEVVSEYEDYYVAGNADLSQTTVNAGRGDGVFTIELATCENSEGYYWEDHDSYPSLSKAAEAFETIVSNPEQTIAMRLLNIISGAELAYWDADQED